GAYNDSLLCNITLNNILLTSFSWNNSVKFDLSSLAVGTYKICLQLFNTTDLIIEDIVWVAIYPTSPPGILSFPANQSITWNESLVLSWDVFDISPSTWTILLNDSPMKSDIWEGSVYQLNWNVPVLNEGIYNITLVLYDLIGHRTAKSTWITINPPNSPIITAFPQEKESLWKKENVTLVWEVHGGLNWILWKNETMLYFGEVTNNHISIQIDWQANEWNPATYNLTLQVTNGIGGIVRGISWIQIKFGYILGDPYVNSVVIEASLWYTDGDNAIGPPDGNYSHIFFDYGNGYLTSDMGEYEAIIDGTGVDFTVFVRKGNYTVYVGNETTLMTYLDWGSGNKSFDLAVSGVISARYIRIEYRSGTKVEVDAIEAINYNRLEDNEAPQITGLADFWIWEYQTEVTLAWNVSEVTPWNYSLLMDGNLISNGPWDGSNISFTFNVTNKVGLVQITLILYDYFDNRAEHNVIIGIRPLREPGTWSYVEPSRIPTYTSPYSFLALLSGVVILLLRRKCSQKKLET
ncbi:MAG: hypothetical protein ACFFBD_00775, partial [Candidatus Hodarchaeota archaeon]